MFDVNTFVSKQYGNPSGPITTKDDQSPPLDFGTQKIPNEDPAISGQKSGGFDVNSFVAKTYPQPKNTGGAQGLFYDAVAAGSNYILDKGKEGKSIIQGIFDDAALGIGKVQGWCGEYASRLSTAQKVGDNWGGKIDKVDKRVGAKAGDKLVIPLGVTKDANGKVQGLGHVLVAITNEDSRGDTVYAQSNGDGRQNKGLGPGIASQVIYNTKDLQKRYGDNFGFISGQLKVNPFLDKTKMSGTQSGAPIQTPKTPSNIAPQNSILAPAINFVTDRLKQAAQTAKKEIDTKPPPSVDVKDAKSIANYVLRNNITNLQDLSWWSNSPVKKQAYEIIKLKQQNPNIKDVDIKVAQMQPETFLKQGEVNKGSNFWSLVGDVLDPNSLIHQGSTDNQIAARADMKGNLDKVSGQLIQGGQDAQAVSPFDIGGIAKQALGKSIGMVNTGISDLSKGDTAHGVVNTVFGLTPAAYGFNALTSVPVIGKPIEKAADAAFNQLPTAIVEGTVGRIPGVPQGLKDWMVVGLQFGEGFLLHKGVQKALPAAAELASAGKELVDIGGKKVAQTITTKPVFYDKTEVFKALQEINGAPDVKAKPAVVARVKQLIIDSAEGVKQEQALKSSYKNGITLREARDFTGWFNRFFDKAKPSQVAPEIAGLLSDGRKVATGKMDPIEFAKNARDTLFKGESATLRDQVAAVNPHDLKLYENSGQGITQHAEAATKLTQLQKAGQKSVVNVPGGEESALNISTYTYSDGKNGVTVTLNTGETSIQIPMSGAYASPREAVQAVVPFIEKTIDNAWDTKSEQVRVELDRLKEGNFSQISDQGEIMPWEDNYIAPPRPIEVANMTKEEIQAKIDTVINDYIEQGLKPGMNQGVTPGSLIRDEVTGNVVSRSGRQSNNAQWYSEAYKKFGHSPSKAQLREIAVDHLMNGVSDRTIGELPPDENFKKLMQALPTAKAEKILPTERAAKVVEGTGKTKVRGLSMGVEANAIANKLTAGFGDLPEYKQINLSEQAVKASELHTSNPTLAKKIAMGQARPPGNLLPESVFIAVENAAIQAGDIATLNELAHSSSLNTEASFMGQRIRILRERMSESPIAAIQSLIRAREQVFENKVKKNAVVKTAKEAKVKMVKEIKVEIKKLRPTKVDWNGFIESLKC